MVVSKKTIMNKRYLRKLYECFKDLPPFNELRMPPSRKITFEVTNANDYMGLFIPEPMRIQISTLNETFYQICETMLHEMVHVYFYYNHHKDYDQHRKKFKDMSDEICEILLVSREHFV